MSKADINMNSTKFEAISGDPSGTEGQVYYNSTDKKLKYHNGSAWLFLGGALNTDSSKYQTYSSSYTEGQVIAQRTTAGNSTSSDSYWNWNLDCNGSGLQTFDASLTAETYSTWGRVLKLRAYNVTPSGTGGTVTSRIWTNTISNAALVRVDNSFSNAGVTSPVTTQSIVEIGNDTDGWTEIAKKSAGSVIGSNTANFVIYVSKKSDNSIDVYTGVKSSVSASITLTEGFQNVAALANGMKLRFTSYETNNTTGVANVDVNTYIDFIYIA